MFTRFFYNLGISAFGIVIKLASLFNRRAESWINGRKNWKQKLDSRLQKRKPKQVTVWMHAASVGEFEQGRPIIEKLKIDYPDIFLVISFFSPSGFEATRNYKVADHICYIPLDTPSNAGKFVASLNPDVVLWIKYEYWFNIIHILGKRKIPLLLISAIFRERHPFFKWYGGFYVRMLHNFTHIFLQDKVSYNLIINKLDSSILTISGDSRYDRVLDIIHSSGSVDTIENWINPSKKLIVAGSTWPEDELLLSEYSSNHPEIQFIIVPHFVDQNSLENTAGRFSEIVLFSKILNGKNQNESSGVLLIDQTGMLKTIYKYATICYIGGGFSKTGIHNILEAAVYSKPVVFGPKFQDYNEAVEMVSEKIAFSAIDKIELFKIFDCLLSEPDLVKEKGSKAGEFVKLRAGASDIILEFIYKNRLLTKL